MKYERLVKNVLVPLKDFLDNYEDFDLVHKHENAKLYKQKLNEIWEFVGDKPHYADLLKEISAYNSQLSKIIKSLSNGMLMSLFDFLIFQFLELNIFCMFAKL